MWDPWGGAVPEGESAPAAVSEAPTDVSAFVSWLARTATRDLEIAADPNRTSSEEPARCRPRRWAVTRAP